MFKCIFATKLLFTSTLLSAQTQISIDSVSAYVGKVVIICEGLTVYFDATAPLNGDKLSPNYLKLAYRSKPDE